MKIHRSSKITLAFANDKKRKILNLIKREYAKVVNFFIELFWCNTPTKNQLLKNITNLPETWLSARCRKVAAREAIDMIAAVRASSEALGQEPKQPRHYGRHMCWSSDLIRLEKSKTTKFDAWLHLRCIGDGIILDIPVKLHKHYHNLSKIGRRTESYIISDNYVQFCFEIETGPKKTEGKLIGIDTGINTLAATNEGKLYGQDIKHIIEKSNQCKQGSKRQRQLRRYLRHRMDEVVKEVVTDDVRLVVVENLRKMNFKTKGRKNKKTRKLLGAWNYRYWLNRVQMVCEARRSCFRAVPPAYTSRMCPACGHTEQGNRNGEKFLCLKCGHGEHADIVGGKNILLRFLTGPYCAGFKQKHSF